MCVNVLIPTSELLSVVQCGILLYNRPTYNRTSQRRPVSCLLLAHWSTFTLIINITIGVWKLDQTEQSLHGDWLLQRLENVPMATKVLLGYQRGRVFMRPERVIKAGECVQLCQRWRRWVRETNVQRDLTSEDYISWSIFSKSGDGLRLHSDRSRFVFLYVFIQIFTVN